MLAFRDTIFKISYNATMEVLARAEGSPEDSTGEDPLSGSHGHWQNSVPHRSD